MGKPDKCDRCGNDFQKGTWMLHLPHVNDYIYLCHVCYIGLSMVLAHDAKKFSEEIFDE